MSEKGGSPAAMPLRCKGISKRPPPGEPGGDPGGRADRSRSPPQGDEADLDAYATMAYVQSLQSKIDAMETSIKESINATVSTATNPISLALKAAQDGIDGLGAKIEKNVHLAVGQHIDATRKHFQQQLDAFNTRVGEVEAKQEKTDKAIELMAEQIKALQRELATANQQPIKQQFISRDFDREIDATIIKVHADGLVTLAKATESLTKFVVGCDIRETDFTVTGNDTAKFFTIKFTGLPGPASRRAQKVLDSMRSPNGTWVRVYADAVSGHGAVELRMGPDKSPKQIKTEIAGKRLRQAMEREFPNHVWRVDRTKAWITAGWAPVIAHSVRPGRDEPTVLTQNRLASGPTPCMAVGTWNARALLGYQGRRVVEKSSYLKSMPLRKMVLGIQEVHQNRGQLLAFMRKIDSTLDMHSSFAPGHHGTISGGVATVFPAGMNAVSDPVFPGRVLRSVFRVGDQVMIFYNVHNYDLSNATIQNITTRINSDLQWARSDPSRVVLFVTGGFKFSAVGKLKLLDPVAKGNSNPTETSKASSRKWHNALKHLVEIDSADTTHYCSEAKAETAIDRCFCSFIPTQMLQLAVTPSTFSTPEDLSRRRVSDHAALFVSFTMRDAKPSPNQPIAQYITDNSLLASFAGTKSHKNTSRSMVAASGSSIMQSSRSGQATSSAKTLNSVKQPSTKQFNVGASNPLKHRLILTGVKISEDTVTGPNERLKKLVEHWQPVFEGKTVDVTKAAVYLNQFSPTIDFSKYRPPDYETLKKFARRSSSTSPGLDGLPYLAWSAHEKCAEVLWDVMCYMLNGGILPDEVNATVQAFLPKGEEPEDSEHHGCHRDPPKVRVLGLRNTSLKIISSTMNAATATVAAEDMLPVLVSLDIAQAFPSFAHQFIRLALKAMGAPEAILMFFDSMCNNILAMAPCAGQYVPLFYIRSGIIQGCGWSGTLYALGTACFLLNLETVPEAQGRGLCRACADDLGLALRASAYLVYLADVMLCMEILAGLELKAPKCHIIPLAGQVNADLILKLKNALLNIVPKFKDFNICDRLTYLGLLLGPGATDQLIYAKAFNKYRSRVMAHSASDAPAVGASWINASILRFPNGAFRLKDWPFLEDWGVPAPRSLQLSMLATIVRAVTSTFNKFTEIRERLHAGLNSYGLQQSLGGAARGALHLSPPWWKTQAFVETMHQIATATSDHVHYPRQLVAPAVEAARAAVANEQPGLAQKHAFASALATRGPDGIGPFLLDRIVKELPRAGELFIHNPAIMHDIQTAMKRLPPSWATAWMRTLSFSWLTSYRIAYPSGRRQCIFGCASGQDKMRHYLVCAPLAQAAGRACGAPPLSTEFAKLGLADQSNESAESIAVACPTYHVLRQETHISAEATPTAARAALRATKTLKKPEMPTYIIHFGSAEPPLITISIQFTSEAAIRIASSFVPSFHFAPSLVPSIHIVSPSPLPCIRIAWQSAAPSLTAVVTTAPIVAKNPAAMAAATMTASTDEKNLAEMAVALHAHTWNTVATQARTPLMDPFRRADFNVAAYVRDTTGQGHERAARVGRQLEEAHSSLEEELQQKIVDCHEELLQSAGSISELDGQLGDVREVVEALKASIARVRGDVLSPFQGVKRRAILLERMQAVNVLVRRLLRFLFDARKLRTQMEAPGKDFSKAAYTIHELELVLEDSSLERVDLLRNEVAWIRETSARVRKQADEDLRNGVKQGNQLALSMALQVFFSLRCLRAQLQQVLSELLEELKQVPLQAGAGFQQSLEINLQVLTAQAHRVYVLDELVRAKTDPLTHRSFASVLEEEGVSSLIGSFWADAAAVIRAKFMKVAQDRTSGRALVAECPKILQALTDAMDKLQAAGRGRTPILKAADRALLVAAAGDLRDEFIRESIKRLTEPVEMMLPNKLLASMSSGGDRFGGGPQGSDASDHDLPTSHDLRRYAQLLASELERCECCPELLLKDVVRNVRSSILFFTTRLEQIVDTSCAELGCFETEEPPRLRSPLPMPSAGHARNARLYGIAHHTLALLKDVIPNRFQATVVTPQVLTTLQQTQESIVMPSLGPLQRVLAHACLHREALGERTEEGSPSLLAACQAASHTSKYLLALFGGGQLLAHQKRLCTLAIRSFLSSAALAKPRGEALRRALVQDMQTLETALCAIDPEFQSHVQHEALVFAEFRKLVFIQSLESADLDGLAEGIPQHLLLAFLVHGLPESVPSLSAFAGVPESTYMESSFLPLWEDQPQALAAFRRSVAELCDSSGLDPGESTVVAFILARLDAVFDRWVPRLLELNSPVPCVDLLREAAAADATVGAPGEGTLAAEVWRLWREDANIAAAVTVEFCASKECADFDDWGEKGGTRNLGCSRGRPVPAQPMKPHAARSQPRAASGALARAGRARAPMSPGLDPPPGQSAGSAPASQEGDVPCVRELLLAHFQNPYLEVEGKLGHRTDRSDFRDKFTAGVSARQFEQLETRLCGGAAFLGLPAGDLPALEVTLDRFVLHPDDPRRRRVARAASGARLFDACRRCSGPGGRRRLVGGRVELAWPICDLRPPGAFQKGPAFEDQKKAISLSRLQVAGRQQRRAEAK
ncbi:unnamed protein product [Prorocentrum cordatum]|uniref:Conserved oligomeric Golgi complex subunit 5 n=1 Tax=Prorocentrum cordatum TaxID=2364126 RepID=A0ABN9RR39_9DINO|nr:unnamed protein product [Polarella glacialis]